jgi:hypothetical protein
VWYHYDVPKVPLGASLLLMNIGMQAGLPDGELDNDKGVLLFSFALVFEVRGTKGIASHLVPRTSYLVPRTSKTQQAISDESW